MNGAKVNEQVLERAHWTFERVRGSAFYRDPDTALLPLWERLSGLGVPTGDWWSDRVPQPTVREVSGPGTGGTAGTAVRTSVT